MQVTNELRKAVVRFLLITLGIYGLLTHGWSGFSDLYARGFRAALRATLVSPTGVREVDVPEAQPMAGITGIVIANRKLLAPDGSGPIRNVNLPNATFWHASALLLALSLATPCRWSQRMTAVLVGLLLLYAFIAGTISFALWNEGRHVGLSAISPAWAATTDRLETILVEQATLVIPFLAWFGGLWPRWKRL
jgi:hypothetical protein